MRIVFWQNCLSPHQLPYIVHLLDDERVDKVIIATGEAVSVVRKEMGWEVAQIPGLDRCEVYLNPIPQTIDFLLSDCPDSSYHLFSGIRGFQFVFDAFKKSLKYNLKRGLITERPYTFAFSRSNGKPLWLHRLRFFVQDRKFVPYIHYVFAMGMDAVGYFQSLCKNWKVFPFAYCTNCCELSQLESSHNQSGICFLFIGSLSKRKAPINILKSVACLSSNSYHINFVGDGPERNKMEHFIRQHGLTDNVSLLGTKPNSEIPSILSRHDILILPSIYDGWGAVVNEALQCGLYVICSDKCGAKELLTDKRCGKVFQSGNDKELSQIMQYCIEHITEIRANRRFRQLWAERCISGKVIAHYMVDCLSGKEPCQPWKR